MAYLLFPHRSRRLSEAHPGLASPGVLRSRVRGTFRHSRLIFWSALLFSEDAVDVQHDRGRGDAPVHEVAEHSVRYRPQAPTSVDVDEPAYQRPIVRAQQRYEGRAAEGVQVVLFYRAVRRLQLRCDRADDEPFLSLLEALEGVAEIGERLTLDPRAARDFVQRVAERPAEVFRAYGILGVYIHAVGSLEWSAQSGAKHTLVIFRFNIIRFGRGV